MNDLNKKKVVFAISFVLGGFGLSQVIRLIGNVILSRLLVPEFFGIMALCNIAISGLTLFSDIGIAPAVIRSPRSDDPIFLNSAWTLKIIRGIVVSVAACLIAYPFSLFYEEKILFTIIPFIGLSSIINGFQSTSYLLLDKQLKQGLVNIIELVAQILSMAVMLAVAYFTKSIWSLAISSIVRPLIITISSFFINREFKHHFVLEKEALKEILSFGKWIFIATALTFLGNEADRMLLGKFLPLAFFGVYNIAAMLANLPKTILSKITNKIIFPIVTHYVGLPRNELREKLGRPRFRIILLLAPIMAIGVAFGDFPIRLLYDDRYLDAAWIFPMLLFGIWPILLHQSVGISLIAFGKSQYTAATSLARFIYIVIGVPLISYFFGTFFVVVYLMFVGLITYTIVNIGLHKERLTFFKHDFLATCVFLLTLVLLFSIRLITGLGMPGHDALMHMVTVS
jgi:O-antigen/teichoic acid export membrane protein